jgi:hypothetical protein
MDAGTIKAVPSSPKTTAFVAELLVRVRRASGNEAENGLTLGGR